MQKQDSEFLKGIGFEKDRSFYESYVMELPSNRLVADRETSYRFDFQEMEEGAYRVSVSLIVRNPTISDFSEQSIWLFSRNDSDVRKLVKESIAIVGRNLHDSVNLMNGIYSKLP